MAKPNSRVSRFLLEIFSIFLGVTIAFLANHLNEVRKDRITEQKILVELNIELRSDFDDAQNNINGHRQGLIAIDLFERYCRNEQVDRDSLGVYFERLYRDYLSITNTTAYETLKSKGIEIIENESLRGEIVELYDFYYEILEKLEEQYHPAQFHKNYFSTLTKHFKNYIEVKDGKIEITKPYAGKVDAEILIIFKEIRDWRNFLMASYSQTLTKITNLRAQIEKETELNN